MKFLHIADTHLGFEQYGVRERFDDFSRTFLWLMNFAKEQKVDFVVLAGDLFHKRTVAPLAMRVAIHGFALADCPIIAVEGNHEKAYYSDQKSWVDFLDETDSIRLLDHECLELDGVRLCGMKYAGASADDEIRDFVSGIKESDLFTILILHAGLEGQFAHAGRLTHETVKMMEPIDYLALGHIHKPYVVEKAYNPGSPETVSADESLWPQRGALLIEAPSGHGGDIRHQVIVPPRRAFHRFDVGLDGCPDPKRLYDAMEYITSLDIAPGAVLDVVVTGQIQFARSELDIKGSKEILKKIDPLVAHIRNETTPVGFSLCIDGVDGSIDAEKAVLSRVIARDARYRDNAAVWVDRAITVKNLALISPAEAVVEYLEGL